MSFEWYVEQNFVSKKMLFTLRETFSTVRNSEFSPVNMSLFVHNKLNARFTPGKLIKKLLYRKWER